MSDFESRIRLPGVITKSTALELCGCGSYQMDWFKAGALGMIDFVKDSQIENRSVNKKVEVTVME